MSRSKFKKPVGAQSSLKKIGKKSLKIIIPPSGLTSTNMK